jgi:hypothetical protein
MMQSKVFEFLPLAERLARQSWRAQGGERRGVDFDDVMSDVHEAICKLAPDYDEKRGTVVALLDVVVPRVVNAAFRKHDRHDAQPLDDVAHRLHSRAQQENAPALRQVAAWAGQDEERRSVLETIERGQRLNRRQRELATDLRARVGAAAHAQDRRRRMAASSAGLLLRQPARRVRELCESGELPAERAPDNTWNVKRRDVLRLRHKRIASALDQGMTHRAAAKASCTSKGAVCRAAKRSSIERPRGRPPLHDRAEILAALTDATRAPQCWRNGYPVLRAVARHVGCHKKEVDRVYKRLMLDRVATNAPHVAQRR